MSTVFSDREHAFEAEFAYRNERAFRDSVHALRALARWAAAEMELSPSSAADYVQRSGEMALEGNAVDRLTARVLADLTASGIEMTEGRLRLKYQRFLAQAAQPSPSA